MFFSGVSKQLQPVSCAEDIRLHHQRDALSSTLAGHLVRHNEVAGNSYQKHTKTRWVNKDPLQGSITIPIELVESHSINNHNGDFDHSHLISLDHSHGKMPVLWMVIVAAFDHDELRG